MLPEIAALALGAAVVAAHTRNPNRPPTRPADRPTSTDQLPSAWLSLWQPDPRALDHAITPPGWPTPAAPPPALALSLGLVPTGSPVVDPTYPGQALQLVADPTGTTRVVLVPTPQQVPWAPGTTPAWREYGGE